METEPGQALVGPAAPNEVLRALAARRRAGSQPLARDDGLRIALVIEGGGMRGVVSAGMALALDELGLVPAFDAVYGASAGAITGAWLLSRPEGLRGWAEPAYAKTLIRRTALLRGRPVADVRALIEDLYQTTFPMDFAAVLASPVEFRPLATDAATGQSIDLRPFIGDPAELRLALRASASLPLLAGPPVEFAGRRFYDAGVSESIPYRTALAQGANHLLILRSAVTRAPRPTAIARLARLGCSPAPPCAARPPPCAPPSWPASPAWPPTTSSSPTTKPPQSSQQPLPSQLPIPRCFPSAPPPTHLRSAAWPPTAPFCTPPSKRAASPPTAPSTLALPIPDQSLTHQQHPPLTPRPPPSRSRPIMKASPR